MTDQLRRLKRRRLLYATGMAAWLIWISGVFGNSGLIQAYDLAQVRRDMTLKIKALENEKERLEGTLQSLESDPFVQEQAIRDSLGLVRQNELVFEFR